MSFWDLLYYTLLIIGGSIFLLITVLAFLVSGGLERRDGPTGKPFTFHERIFYNVANDLNAFARLFKITYNEINILVFYFLIPFTWVVLLDIIFEFHYLKIAFGIFCFSFFILIRNVIFIPKKFSTQSMSYNYAKVGNFWNINAGKLGGVEN